MDHFMLKIRPCASHKGVWGGVKLQLYSFLIYAPHYMVVTTETQARPSPMQIKAECSLETSKNRLPIDAASDP